LFYYCQIVNYLNLALILPLMQCDDTCNYYIRLGEIIQNELPEFVTTGKGVQERVEAGKRGDSIDGMEIFDSMMEAYRLGTRILMAYDILDDQDTLPAEADFAFEMARAQHNDLKREILNLLKQKYL